MNTENTEDTVEVDLDLDKENCPVGINKDGNINKMPDGNRIPKNLFFGKDSPCDNTFHGKHQFYLYMAASYTEQAADHKASKDPKVKKTQKIEKMKKMLAALEAEVASE